MSYDFHYNHNLVSSSSKASTGFAATAVGVTLISAVMALPMFAFMMAGAAASGTHVRSASGVVNAALFDASSGNHAKAEGNPNPSQVKPSDTVKSEALDKRLQPLR